ncbi:hypothetical protein BDB01DRAFT_847994 [Pilobolus umbonatus]|nr:hypothetical protein BDB01DRAFT_847994 [Pilobolus umbonatus]
MKADKELVEGDSSVPVFDDSFFDFEYDGYLEFVKEQKVHYHGISRQILRRKELKAIEEKKKGQADLLSFGFNKTKEWKKAVGKLEIVLNCTISNDSSPMKNIQILKHRPVHLYFKNLIKGLNNKFIRIVKELVVIIEPNLGQFSVNSANIIWLGKESEVYQPKAIVG